MPNLREKFIFILTSTLISIISVGVSNAKTNNIPQHISPEVARENTAKTAYESVFTILCPHTGKMGTAFLHKSGYIITASHVVESCPKATIRDAHGVTTTADIVAFDDQPDLAILRPAKQIHAQTFPIESSPGLVLGQEIIVWGFPGGYTSTIPLLSVGYYGGVDQRQDAEGRTVTRSVVNAAINHGDSGGPLINIQTGKVIGVVSSKLVPISTATMSELNFLLKNSQGLVFTKTMPDGTRVERSETQIVGDILYDLANQVQLVVGYATLLGDLKDFLIKNHISP